jgi:hypothetical protein
MAKLIDSAAHAHAEPWAGHLDPHLSATPWPAFKRQEENASGKSLTLW